MTRITLPEGRQAWLDVRHKHVGASEVSALFGLSPFLTHYELWHRKAGNLPEPDLSDNERIFWGQVLEPVIADAIAKRQGLSLRKVNAYHQHDTVKGMGASLDYEIVGDDRGVGVLECKTVDRLIYNDWPDGEPPLHYQLQLQHQLACRKCSWGMIGVLVGGNELKSFIYDAHKMTMQRLAHAVDVFWQTIADNAEPRPDFERDHKAIEKLYGASLAGHVIDLSTDNHIATLAARYKDASAAGRAADDVKKACKAEIIDIARQKIGDIEAGEIEPPKAKILAADGYSISLSMVSPTPVPAHERAGFLSFRVNKKKEKTR